MKKQFKDTKFNAFLKKAKENIPEITTAITMGIQGNYLGAFLEAKDIIVKSDNAKSKELLNELEENEERFNKELEVMKVEVDDRKDARKLFINDSLAQKILAALFTVAYFGISYFLVNHFFNSGDDLNDYELGFVSTLFGAMSSKVNTIIDFFFGGSMKS